MSPQETIAEVQGASAISSLLTEVMSNPEFEGFVPEKATVNAEAELVLV